MEQSLVEDPINPVEGRRLQPQYDETMQNQNQYDEMVRVQNQYRNQSRDQVN